MPSQRPQLLPADRVVASLASLPEWRLHNAQIECSFQLPSFALAVAFVNQVAKIAETMDHHPEIDIRFNQVHLRLTTHSAGGLTALDIEAAAQIQALAQTSHYPPLSEGA